MDALDKWKKISEKLEKDPEHWKQVSEMHVNEYHIKKLKEKDTEIERLKMCIEDYEEDCAVLPEDQSVTETVNALRNRIKELEEEKNKGIENENNSGK